VENLRRARALRRWLPGAEIEFRRTAGDATLEFGRFRMLLRRRQILAEGAPIELGSPSISS
jgi:hypothetical protein